MSSLGVYKLGNAVHDTLPDPPSSYISYVDVYSLLLVVRLMFASVTH